jgi:hypothetical protein
MTSLSLALLCPFSIISNTDLVPIRFHSHFSVSWTRIWNFLKQKLVVRPHCSFGSGKGLIWQTMHYLDLLCSVCDVPCPLYCKKEGHVFEWIMMLCGTGYRCYTSSKFSITVWHYELLQDLKFSKRAFWVVIQHSVAVGYQRFRGTCCLHLQGEMKTGRRWRQQGLLKCWCPIVTLYSITTQRTSTWIMSFYLPNSK